MRHARGAIKFKVLPFDIDYLHQYRLHACASDHDNIGQKLPPISIRCYAADTDEERCYTSAFRRSPCWPACLLVSDRFEIGVQRTRRKIAF
jgi:hypothetical protein